MTTRYDTKLMIPADSGDSFRREYRYARRTRILFWTAIIAGTAAAVMVGSGVYVLWFGVSK